MHQVIQAPPNLISKRHEQKRRRQSPDTFESRVQLLFAFFHFIPFPSNRISKYFLSPTKNPWGHVARVHHVVLPRGLIAQEIKNPLEHQRSRGHHCPNSDPSIVSILQLVKFFFKKTINPPLGFNINPKSTF